ncbi:hypothetical protein LTR50_004203 [Elasticomyces elasticus]|nr:hypothetical protein LTR50_004203 [Elasticomyces elasticus]
MPLKDKYTDPELLSDVKEEILQGDKGSAPGQLSAREAQTKPSESKKRGGGYTTDKKDRDRSHNHLSEWSEEGKHTKKGGADKAQEEGMRKRFSTRRTSDAEADAAEEEAFNNSEYVENDQEAADEDKDADEEQDVDTDGDGEQEEPEYALGGMKAPKAGRKRGRTKAINAESSKKRRTSDGAADAAEEEEFNATGNSKTGGIIGSRHDSDAPAQAGSKGRLPKKGQRVQWKSLSGYVDGEVVEVATEEKEVDGKKVNASEDDPRVVLKSISSGKIAVHKPEAVFFH